MRGVAETRLTVEKLLKGHNSGKNQLSMTSIKYVHLHLMGTITGKLHQNPLKTVGGVAETNFWMDGLTDKPITIVPFIWTGAKMAEIHQGVPVNL